MTLMRSISYSGFSLVEMAVVLAIVGLLLGSLLLPLGAQIEQQQMNETQRRLEMARDALAGFATANRRMPCPASATSLGVEVILTAFTPGGGACTLPWTGYVPAATLGLLPVDSNKLFVDAWGNPIRYAVTDFTLAFTVSGNAGTRPFTSTDGMRSVYNASSLATLIPDLRVCSTATGISGSGASADCAASSALISNAVAVVFSTGKNTPTGGTGTDEAANLNSDRVFISHTPATATGNQFDDIVLWLSSYLLYTRMIAGGALP
jgi:prepilin-type N-terminal cleavage/methylation domain-containing protein